MKYILSIIILFSVVSITRAQQNFDTVRIRPVKVTEQIYMLKGSGGNIGVMIGKDGTLMIDNQFAHSPIRSMARLNLDQQRSGSLSIRIYMATIQAEMKISNAWVSLSSRMTRCANALAKIKRTDRDK
jgi:hypothetical protein